MINCFKFQLCILLMGIFIPIGTMYAQNPNWSVNSANYSLDASVVGELLIDNQVSTDTNDQVAVFDGNNVIRGVANVSFVASLNKHLVFLTLLSNTNGDQLTFKVYDASEDKVYEATNTAITFEPNKVFGSNDNPFQITAKNPLAIQENTITGFSMYPNPVKHNVFIQANEQFTQAKVFSVLGKEVINQSLNSNKAAINLQNLPQGMYLLKLYANDKTITRKLVKL